MAFPRHDLQKRGLGNNIGVKKLDYVSSTSLQALDTCSGELYARRRPLDNSAHQNNM